MFLASGEEERKNTEMKELEKPIQAWIGVDWADQKHDVSLYEVSTGKQSGTRSVTRRKQFRSGWETCDRDTEMDMWPWRWSKGGERC